MIPPGKKSLSRGSQNKLNEKVKTFKIDVSQPTSKSRLVPIHSSVLLGQMTNYTRLRISKENTKTAFFLLRCLYVKGGVPSFFWENPRTICTEIPAKVVHSSLELLYYSQNTCIRTLWIKNLLAEICHSNTPKIQEPVWPKRRGLGPRNDVFSTCKAVTLRGGQRVIGVFPTLNTVKFRK